MTARMPTAGAHGAQTLPTLSQRNREETRAFSQVAARSHPGHLRENNEDHYLVLDVRHAVTVADSSVGGRGLCAGSTGTLLVVADGMGGHANGELASAIAIDTIAEFARRGLPVDPSSDDADALHTGFQEAALECQRRIRAAALRKGLPDGMGTTLTALYAQDGHAEIAHVGDSRAYLIRPGAGCWRLTHDHTLGAEIEKASGEAAPAVAHILTNAIGGSDAQPRVEALHLALDPSDRLLVCSDGLTRELDDATIGALVASAPTASDALEALFERALAAEARDNITAIVAQL